MFLLMYSVSVKYQTTKLHNIGFKGFLKNSFVCSWSCRHNRCPPIVMGAKDSFSQWMQWPADNICRNL